MFQSTHPHRVLPLESRYGPPNPCFNPRTRIGCYIPMWFQVPLWLTFQSTHPHRVLHDVLRSPRPCFAFQSTHPHRVLLRLLCGDVSRYMFQSTHPHRVLRPGGVRMPAESGFNPRTRIGCYLPLGPPPLSRLAFQSTHPHRVLHNRISGNS